ncbi:carbohydrate binding family 9 domain-containing protein [Inquilinus sp. KBS0705]|nr:carbohydrate binding family 9 domain-containing protein [Inquilinus sp. KBS0705]
MRIFTTVLLSFVTLSALAQAPKRIIAVKTNTPPKIDGVLDDKAWENVPIATDFVELQPTAGLHEKNENRTEVKFIYDNDAIYISARMYESDPSQIAREFATRDNVGTADFIGVIFDTYKDGINGSGFFVTTTNGQFDAKYAPNPNGNIEDPTWNAVWTSQAKIDAQGWTAEMRIPYSALRFAKKDIQTWGMNLIRKRVNEQKQLWWNEVDPKKNGLINQEGELSGLQKLEPPVRLAFYPYFSTYVNHYPYNTAGVANTTTSVNGGMDVKYGINESFTLDLTLIPDFGQVQSDNKILNLTPFEVKYNENRSFFTEGTELFNKGNLFYSRRVGGSPIDYSNAYAGLKPGESVIKNPTETKLINAFKFSGRTAKGLGIGVFNGITNTAYATIEDSIGNRRQVQTSPLTNYNIIVLDQNLKNNSAVTFINTNVYRFGKDYNADVGGFVFNLNNKKNTYNLSGFGFLSNKFYQAASQTPTQTGYSYEVSGGKTSGNFTWNVVQDLASDKYDANDLGYYTNANYIDNQLNLQYAEYKPKWIFTQWGIWTNTYYSVRYQPSSYQAFNQNFGGFANFKNNWYANINGHVRLNSNDFYESRTAGLVFKRPETFILNWNLRTSQAKQLWGGFWLGNQWANRYNGTGTDLELFYTYRVSNRFSFGSDVTISPRNNSVGFATITTDGTASVFGLRDVRTVDNIFNVKYTFSNVMGLNLRLRHYWSKVNYKQFFSLRKDGSLIAPTTDDFDHDVNQNYNIWNIDMIYVWQFSPGSEISLAWKQSAQSYNNIAAHDYYYNLKDTYNQPQNNNFSVKVLYYIDYQSLRKKKK